MTKIDQAHLLTLYRFLRKEGESFTEAVRDLSKHFNKCPDWIIKNLMEAEEH